MSDQEEPRLASNSFMSGQSKSESFHTDKEEYEFKPKQRKSVNNIPVQEHRFIVDRDITDSVLDGIYLTIQDAINHSGNLNGPSQDNNANNAVSFNISLCLFGASVESTIII